MIGTFFDFALIFVACCVTNFVVGGLAFIAFSMLGYPITSWQAVAVAALPSFYIVWSFARESQTASD